MLSSPILCGHPEPAWSSDAKPLAYARMLLSEVFYSIQGEGKLAGIPSVFVRTSGCNLRCVWCDTPYASWRPEGTVASPEEVLGRMGGFASRHAVITGGEPLIQQDIEDFCRMLKAAHFHVTVETAGTIFKPLQANLLSISPKLSNSTPDPGTDATISRQHEQMRLQPAVLQQWIDLGTEVQFKFVVQEEADVAEIHTLLDDLHGWRKEDILLMPEGRSPEALAEREAWIVEICKRESFRYCPRLHVHIWGDQRGV
jgi:7-carboxy-7-deazaguanine synthase